MSAPFPYPYTEQRLPAPHRPARRGRGRSPTARPVGSAFASYAAALDSGSQDFEIVHVRHRETSGASSLQDWQHVHRSSSVSVAASSGDSVPGIGERAPPSKALLVPRATSQSSNASNTGDSVPDSDMVIVDRATGDRVPDPLDLEVSSDEELQLKDVGKSCAYCGSLYSRRGEFCSFTCQTRSIVQGLPYSPPVLESQATVSLKKRSHSTPAESSVTLTPGRSLRQRQQTVPEDTVFVSQHESDNVSTKLVQISRLEAPQGSGTHVLLEPYSGMIITERTQKILCLLTVAEAGPLLEPFTSKVTPSPEMIEEIVAKYNLFKVEARARRVWQTPSIPKGRAVSADQRMMDTNLGALRTRPLGSCMPFMCPDCRTPRSYEPSRNLPCFMCRSKKTPVANVAPPIILSSDTGHWKMLTDDATGSIEWVLCEADGRVKHPVLGKLVKQSMEQEIGGLCSAPMETERCAPSEQSMADFRPTSAYFNIEEIDYSDVALHEKEGDSVPEPLNRDSEQKTVTFHPDLITSYNLLCTSKERWADYDPLNLEEEEKVEQAVSELAALREGALESDTTSTTAAMLLQHLDTEQARIILMSRLKGSQATAEEANLLLAAQTTAEKARAQNLELQRKGAENIRQLRPCPAPPSLWDDKLRKALEKGDLCPLHPMGDVYEDDIVNATRKYISIKSALSQGQIPFAPHLTSDMPDVEGQTEANPLLLLKWMMTRQAGTVRLLGGKWVIKSGPLLVPAWANEVRKLTDDQLLSIERRTWPAGDSTFTTKEYTDEDLEWHVSRDRRPRPSQIRNLYWAVHDDPEWHWVREVQTWDLPSLFTVHGEHYTAKELWAFWMSLPILQPPVFRGDRVPQRKKKMEDYLLMKAATRDLLDHFGVPQPKTKEDWHLILKSVGKFIAAKTFITVTPQAVMNLPVQEGHDDIEHLRLRAICDDAIQVPLEMLRGVPEIFDAFQQSTKLKLVTVRHFWRCNNVLYWPQKVTDPPTLALFALRDLDPPTGDSVPGDEVGVHGSSSQVDEKLSVTQTEAKQLEGLLPPPCVERLCCRAGTAWKRANGYTKTDQVFWFKAECGLVLSSVTPWEVKTKVAGETKGGYVCRHCQGFWRPGRGGGRFLQISDGEVTLQLITDEPPGPLYAKWIRSRVEWYKRVAPRAPLTDEKPNLDLPAKNRIRCGSAVSEALWAIVLSNPEEGALQEIERLASEAVSKENAA